MSIAVGEKLPEGTFLVMNDSGPAEVSSAEKFRTGKVVIFGLPGAFTPTCTQSHLPGFVENADAIRAKGVSGIYCVTVNDPFVAAAFADGANATAGGVEVLADADGSYVKALGMDFTAPPGGLYGRSKRFSLVAENGVVTALQVEESPGVCEITSGATILDMI